LYSNNIYYYIKILFDLELIDSSDFSIYYRNEIKKEINQMKNEIIGIKSIIVSIRTDVKEIKNQLENLYKIISNYMTGRISKTLN